MDRRHWLLGGVAAAAGAAGIGWQMSRPDATAASQDAELWRMRFPTPDGGELAMDGLRGQPLLLNFWATWCPPCVKELPEFDRFQRQFSSQGWRVVGLAVDGPTPVKQFLAKVKVSFPIGLAGFEGTDLSRRLGNSSGALPFTVVFNAKGTAVQRKLGETSFDQLVKWAQQA